MARFLLIGALLLASQVSAGEADQQITLLFGGDVLIGRHTNYSIEKYGQEYPFLRLAGQIRAADIAFCNQEAPIGATGKPISDKKFLFQSRPWALDILKDTGFDIVSLANNHAGDYGDEALVETLERLAAAGIAQAGAGRNLAEAAKPAILEHDGVRFAFHAYSKTLPFSFFATEDSPGTLGGDERRVAGDLNASAQVSDFQIVSVHWGQELMTTPKAYQIEFARLAIDAGADMVIGHHPHVLQGFEYYKGKLIAYSLGNLAFSSYSYNVETSALLTTHLRPDGAISAYLDGLDIHNPRVDMQPRRLNAEQATKLMKELDGLSRDLGAKVVALEGGRGMVVPLQELQ